MKLGSICFPATPVTLHAKQHWVFSFSSYCRFRQVTIRKAELASNQLQDIAQSFITLSSLNRFQASLWGFFLASLANGVVYFPTLQKQIPCILYQPLSGQIPFRGTAQFLFFFFFSLPSLQHRFLSKLKQCSFVVRSLLPYVQCRS